MLVTFTYLVSECLCRVAREERGISKEKALVLLLDTGGGALLHICPDLVRVCLGANVKLMYLPAYTTRAVMALDQNAHHCMSASWKLFKQTWSQRDEPLTLMIALRERHCVRMAECAASHAVYMLLRGMHWVSRLGVGIILIATFVCLHVKFHQYVSFISHRFHPSTTKEMIHVWKKKIHILLSNSKSLLNIWSNYSDLTRPHPKWWFSKEIPLISGKSRLVKYYSIWPEIQYAFKNFQQKKRKKTHPPKRCQFDAFQIHRENSKINHPVRIQGFHSESFKWDPYWVDETIQICGNFEGFPENNSAWSWGWCHIMTPVWWGYLEGEQPYLGDLLTMLVNNVFIHKRSFISTLSKLSGFLGFPGHGVDDLDAGGKKRGDGVALVSTTFFWVVVSNIFYLHPYLGKWSKLTNIFQMGWNHQPEEDEDLIINR